MTTFDDDDTIAAGEREGIEQNKAQSKQQKETTNLPFQKNMKQRRVKKTATGRITELLPNDLILQHEILLDPQCPFSRFVFLFNSQCAFQPSDLILLSSSRRSLRYRTEFS